MGEGVTTVEVNYGTEQATVTHSAETITFEQLQTAITGAGYTALRPGEVRQAQLEQKETDQQKELEVLAVKIAVSGIVSALAMSLMFLPDLLSPRWQLVVLCLMVTPVQFWAGWQSEKKKQLRKDRLHPPKQQRKNRAKRKYGASED